MADLTLEFGDIQAMVRGFRRAWTYARYLYLRIDNADDGKAFLEALGTPSSIADHDSDTDDLHWNIAFTRSGLKQLGVDRDIRDSFPDDFNQGMELRASANGDINDNAPISWDPYWRGRGIDVWIGLFSRNTRSALTQMEGLLKASISTNNWAVQIVAGQDAARLQANTIPLWIDDPSTQPPPGTLVEHFGFNDAVSTPAVLGLWDNLHPTSDPSRVPGNGKLEDGRWQPLAAGEFLLGHVDEIYEIPIAPQPNMLAHNGTFMVYRKLQQQVDEFRAYLIDLAAQLPVNADYIAQKIVGRRRDGSSFLDPYSMNDFLFGFDQTGSRCPLGAHIRRANPRDALDFETLLVNRHRILRRSYPYGQLVPRHMSAPDVNQGAGQGLIFIALNSSISRQFEFIQRQWLNFGNELNQGDDRDPLTGAQDCSGRMVIPANAWDAGDEPGLICPNLPSFVLTRGGDYFFLPGIRAYTALVGGQFDS